MVTPCVIGNFTFFADFTPVQLAIVAATAKEVRYQPGDRLMHEGAAASGCWLIERGMVSLDSSQAEPEPLTLQTLGAGDVVGWSWLIPPYRWHFGVVAATPVTAILLDTDRLKRFMDQKPELGYRFTTSACTVLLDRLQNSRQQMAESQLRLKAALAA